MVNTEQLPENKEDVIYLSIWAIEVAMECPFQSIKCKRTIPSAYMQSLKLKCQMSSWGRFLFTTFLWRLSQQMSGEHTCCVSGIVEKLEEQRWFW